MSRILVLVFISFFFTACDKQIKEEKKDLTYSLSENGCETGAVKYNDESDYCQALKDDSRNKFCARSMRYDMFKKSCSNQSWN